MRRIEFVVMAVALAAGCSKKQESDFTPAAPDARKALDTALQAWKSGEKPGDLAGTKKPVIRAEDPDWSAGQKLREFEILKDEPLEGAPGRVFTVKILMDKGSPQEAKYVVFGIDPVQVFRDSVYNSLSGTGK